MYVKTNDKSIPYKVIAAVCLIIAAGLLLLPAWIRNDSDFELTMLDIGQGDCFLIRADGHSILIDGGGQAADATEMAENIVLPYMRTLGIAELDIVFNTHPDNDHIGGLFAVIDEMPTQELCVYSGYTDSEKQQKLLRLAEERAVSVSSAAAGQMFALSDDFTVTVLSPQAGEHYTEDYYNEGSLVLHIKYRELDVLLTGDLNGAEMMTAIDGLNCADIDVLQMPHHGSSNNHNAEWYDNFAPQAVLVSVGRDNKYGHPGSDVIDYWQDRGIRIYRTDQDGACRIIYNDDTLSIHTVL